MAPASKGTLLNIYFIIIIIIIIISIIIISIQYRMWFRIRLMPVLVGFCSFCRHPLAIYTRCDQHQG